MDWTGGNRSRCVRKFLWAAHQPKRSLLPRHAAPSPAPLGAAMQVIAGSSLFIGQDGGLMHMAVALGKPSFTVWGPSSEKLYGYQQYDPLMHQCVHLNLSCRPCNAWIGANNSKAAGPEKCPDHACMAQLTTAEVCDRFNKYVTSLPADVW